MMLVAPPTPATALLAEAEVAVLQVNVWAFHEVQRASTVAVLNVAGQSHVSGMSTQTIGYVTIPDGIVLEEDLQTTGLHVLVRVALAHKQMIVEPHNRVA